MAFSLSSNVLIYSAGLDHDPDKIKSLSMKSTKMKEAFFDVFLRRCFKEFKAEHPLLKAWEEC